MKNQILISVVLVLIFSCSLGTDNHKISDYTENFTGKEDAINRAKEFLKEDIFFESQKEWASKAEVVDAFPLYLEGIDGISYYECKTTVNNEDAGYILVNVDKTDVDIPDYSTSGITTSEYFKTNNRSISKSTKIYRYGHFRFLAIDHSRSDTGEIISQIGFSESEDLTPEVIETLQRGRTRYKGKVLEGGVVPGVNKNVIKEDDEAPNRGGKRVKKSTELREWYVIDFPYTKTHTLNRAYSNSELVHDYNKMIK